eukprot:7274685-Prymnesium_polylepis.1
MVGERGALLRERVDVGRQRLAERRVIADARVAQVVDEAHDEVRPWRRLCRRHAHHEAPAFRRLLR